MTPCLLSSIEEKNGEAPYPLPYQIRYTQPTSKE